MLARPCLWRSLKARGVFFASDPIYATTKYSGCLARLSSSQSEEWLVDASLNVKGLLDSFEDVGKRVKALGGPLLAKDTFDSLTSLLEQYTSISQTVRSLEKAREENTSNFLAALTSKDESGQSKYSDAGKTIKSELKSGHASKKDVYEKMISLAIKLPNRLHASTPLSSKTRQTEATELQGKIQRVGNDFQSFLSHFSTGLSAHTELNLLSASSQYFENVGFISVTPPDFVRSVILTANSVSPESSSFFALLTKDELHQLKSDSVELDPSIPRVPKPEDNHIYHLVGPSDIALSAFLARNVIQKNSMPVRLVCNGRQYSPCGNESFNGSPGFRKYCRISLFGGVATSTDADKLYGELQGLVLNHLRGFTAALQSTNVAACDLQDHEAARWTVTAYRGTQLYTLASLSLCYDYVSRRLMTKVDSNAADSYLHTVTGYALDISQLMSYLSEAKIIAN